MKNLNKHMNSKLKEKHSKELGLKVPDNYFSASKTSILDKVSEEKQVKVKHIIFKRESVVWLAAASIALIFTLTVFKTNVFSTINKAQSIVSDTIEQIENEVKLTDGFSIKNNDILIASLFVEDNEIDEFVNNYVMEELVYGEILNK
ncbi:hypothetical protein [Lutibacter sp.]